MLQLPVHALVCHPLMPNTELARRRLWSRLSRRRLLGCHDGLVDDMNGVKGHRVVLVVVSTEACSVVHAARR